MLWLKLLVHRLFPKWYSVEEYVEEVGYDEKVTNQYMDYVRTKFIKWNVSVDEADIVVHVKHSYFHGDELIGEKSLDVKTRYRFAHPEAESVKLGDKQVFLRRVKECPVFSFGNALYDVTKFWYPDYVSNQLKAGNMLKKMKSEEEISKEYDEWRKSLVKASDEIVMNARC